MKTLKMTAMFALALVLMTSCSKPDDGPGPQPPSEGGENPTNPTPPVETPVNPADYLIDGIAFMTTNDPRIPYIIYHTNGAKTAMIDEDDDGFQEIMVHSEDDFETVISLDEETGLPIKMCSSDGTVALYYFKEANTLLDLAIMRPGETVVYERDLNVAPTSNSAKTNDNSARPDCNLAPVGVTINGVGYSWALGGLCEIRDGNGGERQWVDISLRACQNIFKSIHGGLSVSVIEEKACKQMDNQAGILGLIPGYANCASEGNMSSCIAQGLDEVDNLIENAQNVFDAIGEDTIDLAYGALISGYGEAKITLTWNTTSDIDLWITEPDGNVIFYGNPNSESGGWLDFDDVDGYGPENIFWETTPPTGQYLVQVHYYGDNGEGSTDYTVQVEVDGDVELFSGTLEIENQLNDIATYTIGNTGRSAPIQVRTNSVSAPRRTTKK